MGKDDLGREDGSLEAAPEAQSRPWIHIHHGFHGKSFLVSFQRLFESIKGTIPDSHNHDSPGDLSVSWSEPDGLTLWLITIRQSCPDSHSKEAVRLYSCRLLALPTGVSCVTPYQAIQG